MSSLALIGQVQVFTSLEHVYLVRIDIQFGKCVIQFCV